MVFQGCSDDVESRVEQAILDAEVWGRAASPSDPEQPRRVGPRGRGTSDIRLDVASRPLYRRVRRVVNRSAQLGGPQFSLQIRAQYSKLPIRLLPRDYELPTKRISLLATNPNLS